MNNLFINFQTGDIIDLKYQKEYDINNYIINKDIINFEDSVFFYIIDKKKKYILKSYDVYKQKYSIIKFLKNREDINLWITKEDFNKYFIEYKNKEITQAHIYYHILTVLEGLNVAVFKFQVDKKADGSIFFEYPLPMDNKMEDFFIDRSDVIFIDSPNVYNVICGLLKDNHRVYTTVDKLGFLTVDDLVILKSEEESVVNITEDEYVYVKQLELGLKDMMKTNFIIDMEKYYFEFNILLNYFMSKNIYINMFQKSIENIYESVIETIDKMDDVEIEEELLDKLEELLVLKDKIDFNLRIGDIYNNLKQELLNLEISSKDKEQKLKDGLTTLQYLFDQQIQYADKA